MQSQCSAFSIQTSLLSSLSLFIQALGMKPCLDQALFLALVVVLLIYDIVVLLLLVLVGLMRPNLSVFTSSDQFLD